MTNRRLARNKPYNIKEPQAPRQTKAQRQAAGDAMEAVGFIMIDWNKWAYGGFRVVPGNVDFRPGWIAICEDGRQIPLGTASAEEIKIRLDDEIAAMEGMEVIDFDDFMTAGLPQTNPPVNARPGAEYGVWV